MPVTYKGTIVGFRGSRGSGLGSLVLEDRIIPCENAPTVRALDACFGGVITPGHTADSNPLRGKEIVYSVDDLGLLMAFTPVEDWTGPEIPEEGLVEQ